MDSSVLPDEDIRLLDSMASVLRNDNLQFDNAVNHRRNVKVLQKNSGIVQCRSIVSETKGKGLSIKRTIEYYRLKDGTFKIEKPYFEDDSDSWDIDYYDTVNHSQVLFEMIDKSTEEQRPGFSKDFIPIKKSGNDKYVICGKNKYIFSEPNHLYFDILEGYVHMISYDAGNGSYIFLVIPHQGESDVCFPFLYANDTFTSLPYFFGYNSPVDPLFRNKREREWPYGDGMDFYHIQVIDTTHIRVELEDMRGSTTDTTYIANYVDYEFDRSLQRMRIVGKGYIDEE